MLKNVTITNTMGRSNHNHRSRRRRDLLFIGGNLSITNGAGADYTHIEDTNVGGNVTVSDGHGDGTTAGTTQMNNVFNTGYRSLIKGNLTVSYLDGTVNYDGLWDYEVMGNVAFNHGSGTATTNFDGDNTDLPVLVLGNLTMKGSGGNTVTVGTEFMDTGLIVGGNFTITAPATSPASSLTFTNLQVDGAASIGLGNGANSVIIDSSVFVGSLTITNGSGANNVAARGLDVNQDLSITNGGIVTTLNDLTVREVRLPSPTIAAATPRRPSKPIPGSVPSWGVFPALPMESERTKNQIQDTNIGGNVTGNNGKGNPTSGVGRLARTSITATMPPRL